MQCSGSNRLIRWEVFILADFRSPRQSRQTHGTGDAVAPALVDFSFTPLVIDTTSGDAVVTVTMHVTDAGSGVCSSPCGVTQARFEHSATGQFHDAFPFTLVSGTLNDGIFQAQVTFPQGSAGGTWEVANLTIGDLIGNRVNWNKTELAAAGFPTEVVNTGTGDVVPDLKVNGSDGPLLVTPGESLAVTLALDPQSAAGAMADWWIGLATPIGSYWLTSSGWVLSPIPLSVGQFPLAEIPETVVLNTALPTGIWVPFFILDDNPDGMFQVTWFDYVVALSQSPLSSVDLSKVEADLLNQLRRAQSSR